MEVNERSCVDLRGGATLAILCAEFVGRGVHGSIDCFVSQPSTMTRPVGRIAAVVAHEAFVSSGEIGILMNPYEVHYTLSTDGKSALRNNLSSWLKMVTHVWNCVTEKLMRKDVPIGESNSPLFGRDIYERENKCACTTVKLVL